MRHSAGRRAGGDDGGFRRRCVDTQRARAVGDGDGRRTSDCVGRVLVRPGGGRLIIGVSLIWRGVWGRDSWRTGHTVVQAVTTSVVVTTVSLPQAFTEPIRLRAGTMMSRTLMLGKGCKC